MSSMLGSKLGTALTWPLMGLITDVFGWQWAFYVTALLSFIVSILWYKIVADSPEKHLHISSSERKLIEDSLALVIAKKQDFPPIMKMAKSMPFYALLFLHFSDVWGVFFLLTSAPMFMSQVLKFDLKDAGFASSLPYFARLVFGFSFGFAGDYLMSRGVGATKIRKIFCVFCENFRKLLSERFNQMFSLSAHIIPGLLLFGFCFVDKNPYVCITLITLSLGFNGASTMTSSQNPQDLAPNYAGSVFGLANFFATTSGFISPLVVSYFTREKVSWQAIIGSNCYSCNYRAP